MTHSNENPLLLEYGYWSYSDHVPAIRELLAEKEELLEEFEELYADDAPYADFVAWAANKAVPARVRKLVAVAKGSYGRFDEVEVASGSGPDVGSMVGWSPTLLARRRDGVIMYEISGEESSAPDDSTEPLDEDDVYASVAGDPYWPAEEALEQALQCYLKDKPTLENMLDAVESWGSSAHYSSPFYNLEARWDEYVEGVREAARERAGGTVKE